VLRNPEVFRRVRDAADCDALFRAINEPGTTA